MKSMVDCWFKGTAGVRCRGAVARYLIQVPPEPPRQFVVCARHEEHVTIAAAVRATTGTAPLPKGRALTMLRAVPATAALKITPPSPR